MSFVIPVYNVEKYIPKTLNSLLFQTEKDFEIIVVDDGSTDNTYQVAKEILQNSDFQNYKILRKPNGGVSSARNVGIKEAKGKYIIFLDGDDYVAPELVEEILKVPPKLVDVILWKYLDVDESSNIVFNPFSENLLKEGINDSLYILERTLIERNFWIWIGSIAFSKELIIQNNLFYNEKHSVGEDQEFTYKCLIKAKRVLFIDKSLSYYLNRSTSASRKFSEKHFDVYPALMEVYRMIVNKHDLNSKGIAALAQAIKERAVLNFLSRVIYFSSYRSSSFRALIKVLNQRYPEFSGLIKEIWHNAKTIKKPVSKISFFEKIDLRVFTASSLLFFCLLKFYINLENIVGKLRKHKSQRIFLQTR